MKVLSINFVKQSELPKRSVANTELKLIADQLMAQWPKIPAGQALSVKIDKLGKHHRYALQRKLQGMGAENARVSVDLWQGILFLRKGEAPAPAKGKK